MIIRTLRRRRVASAALLSFFVQACSGHVIDLDQPSGSVSAGSSGDDTVLLKVTAAAAALIAQGVMGYPFYSDIVADDTRLYWMAEDGDVQGCLKDNCAHSVINYANAGVNGYGRIAVGGGYVYWFSSDNTLYACPSTGCARAPTRVIQDSSISAQPPLAADVGDVYWSSALDLYRCAPTGCGSAPAIVAPEQTYDLGYNGPTYSRDNAYWVEGSITVLSSDTKVTVRAAPKDGSAPPTTVLTDSIGPFAAIAADETNVYWTNFSNHILRCPISGCTDAPVVVDASDTPKGYLVLDDSGLYWREDPLDSGPVHFCPLDDCASEVTLTPAGVQSFAADSQYLYWVEGPIPSPHSASDLQVPSGSGIAIHRVAK
jgi:hypothetical protein